ncbi:MAG TPA: hypothetical protein VHA82_00650 [Ramlibacter sp.]|nr:hypothetical protein [Ramlibacter sp.]HVZ42288.1 hypothetical protein [Ramlibacter sp.]
MKQVSEGKRFWAFFSRRIVRSSPGREDDLAQIRRGEGPRAPAD